MAKFNQLTGSLVEETKEICEKVLSDADEAFLKEISSDEKLNKITSNEELEENISNMSSYLLEDID